MKGRHADDPQARPRRGGPRLPPSWPRAPSSCRGGSGPRGGAPSSPSAAQAPTNCGSQRPHLPGPLVTRPLWWRQLSDPRFTPASQPAGGPATGKQTAAARGPTFPRSFCSQRPAAVCSGGCSVQPPTGPRELQEGRVPRRRGHHTPESDLSTPFLRDGGGALLTAGAPHPAPEGPAVSTCLCKRAPRSAASGRGTDRTFPHRDPALTCPVTRGHSQRGAQRPPRHRQVERSAQRTDPPAIWKVALTLTGPRLIQEPRFLVSGSQVTGPWLPVLGGAVTRDDGARDTG